MLLTGAGWKSAPTARGTQQCACSGSLSRVRGALLWMRFWNGWGADWNNSRPAAQCVESAHRSAVSRPFAMKAQNGQGHGHLLWGRRRWLRQSRFLVSRPFAKCANGRGTEDLCLVQKDTREVRAGLDQRVDAKGEVVLGGLL